MFINLLHSLLSSTRAQSLSDEEIVIDYLKTQNGNLFDILYKRYSGKVYAKCISLLKNEARAEDAVQEIFMKVLLNLSKFSGRSKFSTWLYSISYNFCIDTIRKQKKQPSTRAEDIDNREDVADEDINDKFILETNIKRLKVILNEIPLKDKSILLMKYQDEMSIKEISEVLHKSESAVKMKIKRAKQKFKKIHLERFNVA